MSGQTDNSDPRVSDAYRALADERAPDHLDEAVMRMAAKANRTPYAAARAWMRPAAWAAIIGLSLAIVLELTLLPQESLIFDVAPDETAPPAESQADDEGAGQVPVKAPLTEPWRARELPAKATAAQAMMEVESGADLDPGQKSVTAEYLCPTEVRDSADSWYDCIESLRETTPTRRVAAELERLLAAYPEFEVPSQDK